VGENYKNFDDAKEDLVSRLGPYCSYCERHIVSVLAVEHIQPKSLHKYAHLKLEWTNFLLACVNCNSTKRNKDVILSDFLLPDRDNTLVAFTYLNDGSIEPSNSAKASSLEKHAKNTLSLTGLDKPYSEITDSNGKAVALDRIAQRKEALGQAKEALSLYNSNKNNQMMQIIGNLAKYTGYFSIWYNVFTMHPEFLSYLIEIFPGTSGSGCFSAINSSTISPCPNVDNLPCGGKI
jgi:uncharacterized protein (TIGR02646 family)